MVKPTTNQKVLNAAYKHLSTMTKRSVDSKGTCVYLNEKTGSMCGIGGILPKSLLKEAHKIENGHVVIGISSLIRESPSLCKYFVNVQSDILILIQSIHDNTTNWGAEGMLENTLNNVIRIIAQRFNLRSPV